MPRPERRSDEQYLLSSKLFQAVERAGARFGEIAAEHGLTHVQARTLLALDEPLPMRSLAGLMSCDASNITGVADRLERIGAVERVTGEDRRVKLLSLTPEGRRLRARLQASLQRRALVATLSPAEQRQLSRLLDRLLED